MQRIADDFAAINARLAEISAEKAKVRGDEPKIEAAPAHELPSPYYVQSVNIVYQAPDDYCGYKSVYRNALNAGKSASRAAELASEYRDGLIEASLASSRALKKSSDELSRAITGWTDVEIKFYPGTDAG